MTGPDSGGEACTCTATDLHDRECALTPAQTVPDNAGLRAHLIHEAVAVLNEHKVVGFRYVMADEIATRLLSGPLAALLAERDHLTKALSDLVEAVSRGDEYGLPEAYREALIILGGNSDA